jgi:hypothetical protein
MFTVGHNHPKYLYIILHWEAVNLYTWHFVDQLEYLVKYETTEW